MTCRYLQPKQVVHGFELPNAALLRLNQLAGLFRCSHQHIRNLFDAGLIAGVNLNDPSCKHRLIRIDRSSVVEFVETRTNKPKGADYSRTEPPFELGLPEHAVFSTLEVANILACSDQHVLNLCCSGEIRATDIACCPRHSMFRIARTSLIQFLHDRQEGVYNG